MEREKERKESVSPDSSAVLKTNKSKTTSKPFISLAKIDARSSVTVT